MRSTSNCQQNDRQRKRKCNSQKTTAQNDANRGGKDSAGQGKKPINVSTYTKRSGKKVEQEKDHE